MGRPLALILAAWISLATCLPAQALTAGQRIAVLNGHAPCDAAGLAVIRGMTTAPTNQRRKLICTLVRSLETTGVWAKLDAFYVTAAATSQAARINWISPGTNDLSAVNGPTFTPDRGYAGDGATSYLTGINPTGATNFTQNSAMLAAYSLTSGMIAVSSIGFNDGSFASTLAPWDGSNNSTGRINTTVLTSVTNPVSDGRGFYAIDRSAAAAIILYRNGQSITTDTATSNTVVNNTLNIGRSATASFSTLLCAAMAVGGHLTSAQHAALYAAILGYLAPIGANQ